MDAFPTCSDCQQQFTLRGPAPYLLPCLHTVCKTCVTSAARGVRLCTKCQRKFSLADGRVPEDRATRIRLVETFTNTIPGSPQLQLDAARANRDVCHVTTDGELVNSQPTTEGSFTGRLQKYRGTCASRPILLPPSPSTVPAGPQTHQYWETDSRVLVVREGWWGWPILSMGVGEESQVDSGAYVWLQRRSWCVSLGRCPSHRGSLCTVMYHQGKHGECYTKQMSNTPGTRATFHYGVVLDLARGRLAFIDLNRGVVLAKVDVKWSESLLPMFSVGRPDFYTVYMKVISGADITMTDTKKSLIYDALN